jgi:hypothetical protein
MRPLVLWCRWHAAGLRLMGRDAERVWGELAFHEATLPFTYELGPARLTYGSGEGERTVGLDEMGVELDAATGAAGT